jgi:hypothetical protein
MRRALIVALVFVSSNLWAEKPWESRVTIPVAVPIEIPTIPPMNPFSTAAVTPPQPIAMPLREKFQSVFTIQAAGYVDDRGACSRFVVLQAPWPSLVAEIQPVFAETSFSPGKAMGQPTPTWLSLSIDLAGRINEGKVVRMQPSALDPQKAPVADDPAVIGGSAVDAGLPFTSAEKLDQAPTPKRFRARIDSKSWQQSVRLLLEVSTEGQCLRVVFLSCPPGLRTWLLNSMAQWTFRPGKSESAAVKAWVVLEGDIQVEVSSLSSDSLRISRQVAYPHG